jgi:hypothetical protein
LRPPPYAKKRRSNADGTDRSRQACLADVAKLQREIRVLEEFLKTEAEGNSSDEDDAHNEP